MNRPVMPSQEVHELSVPPATVKLTLNVLEAAHILGISRGVAYEAVRRGEIPVIRIGKRLLVPRAALMRLLEQAGQKGVEP